MYTLGRKGKETETILGVVRSVLHLDSRLGDEEVKEEDAKH